MDIGRLTKKEKVDKQTEDFLRGLGYENLNTDIFGKYVRLGTNKSVEIPFPLGFLGVSKEIRDFKRRDWVKEK